MRPGTVRHRHRAHDSAIVLCIGVVIVASACGGATVPRPTSVQVRAEDYVAVPFLPRPPPVEIVPLRPEGRSGLVWADGGWEWSGGRYRWDPGAWVAPPAGARRARWAIVRRDVDGQLFFAPSSWRDEKGNTLPAPEAISRARTGPGGPAGGAAGGVGAGELTGGTATPSASGVRTDLDE